MVSPEQAIREAKAFRTYFDSVGIEVKDKNEWKEGSFEEAQSKRMPLRAIRSDQKLRLDERTVFLTFSLQDGKVYSEISGVTIWNFMMAKKEEELREASNLISAVFSS